VPPPPLTPRFTQHEVELLQSEIATFRREHDDQLNRLLIDVSEIEHSGVTLGKGSFGDVIKAEYRGTPCAVKTMRAIDSENMARFRCEVRHMHTRQDPRARPPKPLTLARSLARSLALSRSLEDFADGRLTPP
jgi:hypothetical protein